MVRMIDLQKGIGEIVAEVQQFNENVAYEKLLVFAVPNKKEPEWYFIFWGECPDQTVDECDLLDVLRAGEWKDVATELGSYIGETV